MSSTPVTTVPKGTPNISPPKNELKLNIKTSLKTP
jgi:hypothetical protein